MARLLFFSNISPIGMSHTKEDIKMALTDIRIASKFCYVQHVNLFPFCLARHRLGSQVM